jgi:hypothetical protein
MSIRIMSKVWESAPFDGYTLLCLIALADSASDEGVCWPSIETLMQKTRQPERTVYQAIKNLRRGGWLEKCTIEGRGSRPIRAYRITPREPGFTAQHAKDSAPPAKPTAQGAVNTAQHAKPPHPLIGGTVIDPVREPSREPARASAPPSPPRFIPPGKPVNDPGEIGDLARAIVCAHPRSLMRAWQPLEVPYSDLCNAIDAIDAEAERGGCSQAQAGEMILARIQAIAAAVPRGEWRYLKPPADFFRLREYRLEPEDFLRSAPAPSSTATQPSFAERDHVREQEEIRAARARRAERG